MNANDDGLARYLATFRGDDCGMSARERLLLQLGKADVMAHGYLEGHQRTMVELIIAEACNHLWQAYISNDPGRIQYSDEACRRLDVHFGKQWRDIDTDVGGKLK